MAPSVLLELPARFETDSRAREVEVDGAKWRLVEPGEVDIGLGCGIHTGEYVVGDVGAARRSQFTCPGGQ